MQYYEHPVAEPLANYIQSLWAIESEHESDAYVKSQIMPDGIVEIIFHYRDPFFTYRDNNKSIQPENFAISMMRKYVEIESSGKTGFVSARFYPWGAYHFFREPVQNFLDQIIDARRLWGDRSTQIIETLKASNSIEERFKLIEQFLLHRLVEFKRTDTSIDEVIKLVRSEKGQLSIEEVCDRTRLSKKQLERSFQATVGTTPKIFSRISRFLAICNNLQDHKGKTLSELSHECGYYDQAHFIKEFKKFSGYTPKEFFQKENVYFSEI